MILETQSTRSKLSPTDGDSPLTRRRRILIAEDDDEMRSLLVVWLRNVGYDVTACCDGIDLLEQMTESLENDRPLPFGLIISDIRMPWVTGIEILKGMRDYIGMPPVVLITAFGDRSTHETAMGLGAAAVIDKPFEMSDLVSRINEIFSSRGY